MKLRNLFIALISILFIAPVIAEETPTASEANLPIAGRDKEFFVQSPDGKFRLNVGGYLQGLHLGQMVEDGTDVNTFRVRRARLKFSGHLYSKDLQYELEYEFASALPASTDRLLSAYIQWAAAESFKIKIGQFYVPFNFEGYASSSNLQFVDRSILQAGFGIADEREPGFGFSGSLLEKKFLYDIGAFNGEGLNLVNQNHEFRYAGRLTYNFLGEVGRDFSDITNSESPQVALGAAGMFNDTPTFFGTEQKITSFTTDLSAKYHGIGAHGEFLLQHNNPEIAASTMNKGFLAQVGYFVMPQELELAVRVAKMFRGSATDSSEYNFGINWYCFESHNVKLQFDYSALTAEDGVVLGDDRLDHRFRTQLQVKL